MSLSTLRRVKVKTFHGTTNREKRSEVVSPGFGDTKWKFHGAAEEYAEAKAILRNDLLKAGLIDFITDPDKLKPDKLKPDIDDYSKADPADPTSRLWKGKMRIAYKKAEEDFDRKKQEAYGILRARIEVNSPAEVLILPSSENHDAKQFWELITAFYEGETQQAAFSLVMKLLKMVRENASEYGTDQLLKYAIDLKKLLDRFEKLDTNHKIPELFKTCFIFATLFLEFGDYMENFVFEEILKDDTDLKDVKIDDVFKRLQIFVLAKKTTNESASHEDIKSGSFNTESNPSVPSKCDHCGGRHFATDCWKKYPHKDARVGEEDSKI